MCKGGNTCPCVRHSAASVFETRGHLTKKRGERNFARHFFFFFLSPLLPSYLSRLVRSGKPRDRSTMPSESFPTQPHNNSNSIGGGNFPKPSLSLSLSHQGHFTPLQSPNAIALKTAAALSTEKEGGPSPSPLLPSRSHCCYAATIINSP